MRTTRHTERPSQPSKNPNAPYHASPSELAAAAERLGCSSIAYAYNDPTVFMEYAIDVAEAARTRLPATRLATLRRARQVALRHDLHYVYTGNLPVARDNGIGRPESKAGLRLVIHHSLKHSSSSDGVRVALQQKLAGIFTGDRQHLFNLLRCELVFLNDGSHSRVPLPFASATILT